MEKIKELAEIFKALSDPNRLRILKLLIKHNCLCVNALSKELNISQSAVSQHLKILRQAEVVQSSKQGFFVHYTINQNAIDRYKDMVLETFGESFLV